MSTLYRISAPRTTSTRIALATMRTIARVAIVTVCQDGIGSQERLELDWSAALLLQVIVAQTILVGTTALIQPLSAQHPSVTFVLMSTVLYAKYPIRFLLYTLQIVMVSMSTTWRPLLTAILDTALSRQHSLPQCSDEEFLLSRRALTTFFAFIIEIEIKSPLHPWRIVADMLDTSRPGCRHKPLLIIQPAHGHLAEIEHLRRARHSSSVPQSLWYPLSDENVVSSMSDRKL